MKGRRELAGQHGWVAHDPAEEEDLTQVSKEAGRPGRTWEPVFALWAEATLNSIRQPSTSVRKQVWKKKPVCKEGEVERVPGIISAV